MIAELHPVAAGTARHSTTLADIERSTKHFADAHADLSACVAELNNRIEALKREHLPGIKRAVARAAERQAALAALVEAAPDLFIKPRTVIFHGVKVGFQKGKGGIEFTDADKVCELVRKHFPDQADVLIRVKETPNKESLVQLSVAELKRLGCTVIESGDQVVIKPTDGEVDKIVTALLKDATAEMKNAE